MLPLRLRAALLLLLLPLLTRAQAPKTWTSADILLGLQKLNVLGSVLYIAAHPDDENTRLIAYLANGRLLETGYFSCTRGDGGQNLIGPEIREQLGLIRTQELLAARRLDGGRQFFARANDFGFSKTSEETFTIWDKEQVLADMVWVIRQRRPDVLITRFPPDARAGHGHHQASAILAAEAFDAAGDPKRFPEQLKYVQAWQPKRLLWNTGSFFVKSGEDMSGYLKVDAGGYNPLLGKSYGEIAALSRSNHKSQGFGSAAQRGEALEYLQPVKGAKATQDPFEGVDLTWNRVPDGAAVEARLAEVIRSYDASNPAASVAGLFAVEKALDNLNDVQSLFWLFEKKRALHELIQACLGLHVEATATEANTAFGQSVEVNWQVINSSELFVDLKSIWPLDYGTTDTVARRRLPTGKLTTGRMRITPKAGMLTSQPYWLLRPGTIGMYALPKEYVVFQDQSKNNRLAAKLFANAMGVEGRRTSGYEDYYGQAHLTKGTMSFPEQKLVSHPENPSVADLSFSFEVEGKFFNLLVPVQYKHTDPVLGELYQPLAVVPPVAVNIGGKTYVFADNQPKTVPVTLRAGKAGVSGSLALALPAGWKAEPASAAFSLTGKDQEQTIQFRVQPGPGAASGKADLRAVATVEGQAYSRGYQTIAYNHIPTQTLFPEATVPLVKLDLKRRGQEIGYLMGAGDEVPDALRQVGYTVTLLKETDVTPENLRRFDAVLLGVRAYNVLDRLRVLQPVLLDYVKDGGNLIVQYVVNRGTVIPQIGPYPLTLSTDRVTVENAPVTFLNPQQPLLNTPNKITAQDFAGWVQEQGLYYPSQWDAQYRTVISSHDPGEAPKESAILVADYGKGHYIYTGLSFFRELPAGVPGAYRLLTNMISLGK